MLEVASTLMPIGRGLGLSLNNARDMLPVLGILLIILALFMGIRQKRKNIQQHDGTAQEHFNRLRQDQGVRHDLESLMVEIEAMAKQLGGQLDAKSIRIEKLMREADIKLQQLQDAARLADLTRQAVHAPPPAAPPPRPAQAPTPTPAPATPTPAPPADPGPSEGDSLNKRVYQLADAGLDAPQIAKDLGEHVGKIELILALRSA